MTDRMPATAGTSQVPTALKYTHIHTTNRLTATGVTVAFANAAFTVYATSLFVNRTLQTLLSCLSRIDMLPTALPKSQFIARLDEVY